MRKSTFSKAHKLIAALMVVCMLVVCFPLSLIASAYQLNAETVLDDVDFDENNIVLNLGVLADQHITYFGYSHDTIKNRMQIYANLVAALDKVSGNKLDGFISCGDYTSHGNAFQAENFVSASKAILDAINTDAASTGITTKFFMGYGNHDTCWRSNMPVSDYAFDAAYHKEQNLTLGTGTSLSGKSDTWEEILNEYGLLDDQGAVSWDDADGDGDDDYLEGTYLYCVEKNGKKFYVIGLETIDYAPNEYREITVEWLDRKLAEITKADPTAYVYIASHAPIAGSGIYGTDATYDKNAGWGSTDNNVVHNVLKKYPQVVYFSGHTHYGTMPETAIMTDTYTAIAVSAMAESAPFASSSGYEYDNAASTMKSTGLGLLVQVDANGNQRIIRVTTPTDYNKVKLMTFATEDSVGTIPNYDGNTWAPVEGANSKWNIVKVTSATLNTSVLNGYTPVIYGDAYLMPAPDAENSHLRYYSKERGEGANISFGKDATVTISDAFYSSKTGLSAVVNFDAATADRNILQYRVTFKSDKGATLATKMTAGNIFDITTGIANGTSHLDATKFSYSMTGVSMTNTPFYVEIVAVDEYLNTSAPIVSNVITPDDSGDAPVFNAAIHHNYFDDMQTTDPKKINSSGNTYFSLEEGYKAFTATWTNSTQTSSAWNKTTFWLDATGYAAWQKATNNGNNSWGTNQSYAMYSTPFDENDTFIYQATFNVSKYDTGHISFNFRSEEKSACAGTTSEANTRDGNDVDREGLRISSSGVELWLGNSSQDKIGSTNTTFKLSADNKDHIVTILSTPEKVSVWIDNELIFYNVSFPGKEGLSTLYPSTTIWVGDIDCTMKDFYMWNPNEKIETGTIGSNEIPYEDTLVIKPTYEINTTTMYTEYDNDSIYFNALEASQDTDSLAYFDLFVDGDTTKRSPFKSTDTVTFEFTYKIDTVYAYNKNNCHDIMVYFRGGKTDPKTESMYLLLRTGNTLLYGTGYSSKIGSTNYVTAGNTYKVKIVSDNKKVSIYINGETIVENYAYSSHDNLKGISENNMPGFGLVFRDIEATVTDFKFSCNGSYGSAIKGVTPPTDENNLIYQSGGWSTNYNGKIFGFQAYANNAYINNYCKAQQLNGMTAYWTGYTVDPTTNYTYDKNKSYVISGSFAKSNRATAPSTIGVDSTSAFTSRLHYVFGTYNGKELSMFIDDSYVYTNKNGAYTNFKSPLVQAIELNEYYRLTAYMTPFGIEVYLNGQLLNTIAIEDSTKFVPGFFFRVNGSEMWMKDVEIWENTENGQKYYDGIFAKYNNLTSVQKGVRFEYTSEENAILAEVKTALDSFDGTSNVGLVPYIDTLNEIKPTVVNNLVADGTTIVGVSANMVLDHNTSIDNDWKYGNFKLFDGKSPFTSNDDFVVEADFYFLDVWYNPRIGFGLNDTADGDIMIQHNTQYVNTQALSWSTAYATTNGTRPTVKNSSNKWHVKFIVKGGESIQTVITNIQDGTLLFDYTAPWNVLRTNSINNEYYNPVFYFACCSVELKNIYVGYDVTDAKNTLDNTVAEYAVKDTEGFSAATVDKFTTALTNANVILGAYEQYSNAEINAAGEAIVSAYAALKKEDVKVNVGDLEIEVAPDEELLVNDRIETKFILGWLNPDGTTYEGTTYIPGLVAQFVETKMMTVKYQLGRTGDAIRYIASVDETERYLTVGWLFSIKNANPEKGAYGVTEKSSYKVYSSLLANGVEKTTADVYGDVDYSKYFYVFEITDIPEASADTVIYVRPYVEMNDGRIVYGDVSEKTLNALKTR